MLNVAQINLRLNAELIDLHEFVSSQCVTSPGVGSTRGILSPNNTFCALLSLYVNFK